MNWQRASAAAAAVVVLIGAAGCSSDEGDATIVEPTGSTSPVTSPTDSAPVPQDSQAPNDPDDGVARDTPSPTPTPTDGEDVARVDMFVSSWGVEDGMLDAGAVVQGIVTEDATCELILSQGDAVLNATGDATRSASSMNCVEGLAVPVNGLTGTWDLVITFVSPQFEGATEPEEVTLP